MTDEGSRLKPCGPVVDPAAAVRVREVLAVDAAASGWSDSLEAAWPALAPVFAASPYLARLARQKPARVADILREGPAKAVAAITRAAGEATPDGRLTEHLRTLKGDLHLFVALADLCGLWSLDQVTGALTVFADRALVSALAGALAEEREAGRWTAAADAGAPGYFCIAMGKYGAGELNYSSDIDYSVFYDPDALALADGVEPAAFAARLTQRVAGLLQDKTGDGYVFRVDLRLRPDPLSTPAAVSVPAALDYYESVGQNWERAAFIKARVCAGDQEAGRAFLAELSPFVWRRNLDFGAISDIHSIKRQIHVHKSLDTVIAAPGADLKLGPGGIREIEFYVQTQQLILGGRDPTLRSPRTLEGLAALCAAGHVAPEAAAELTDAYRILRALEHRAQMIADQQTHRLPAANAERKAIAALYGHASLRTFDAAVRRVLVGVNRRYGELFAEGEDLSSRFGSLVFTGVEDDPQTLETLKRMGFSDPAMVSTTIRSWHHGRINATRTERGRELFTRLAPRLLDAVQASGAPDEGFRRFAAFFTGLSSGVQVQSLFLAQPSLLELVVEVVTFAPNLATTLARRPAALDALLDRRFFAPFEAGEAKTAVVEAVAAADGFEEAMDAARRVRREQAFRIGVQVMSRTAGAAEAGPAFADLADGCIAALGEAALAEAARLGGAFPGEVAVVGLGKAGSREMTAGSDLDLMTLYRADSPDAASEIKGWSAETFYTRFTQRLVAALSLPTAEGELYEVDLRLRPSGTQGPVAVSAAAFEDYYAREAETWELLALTRARVVWATSPDFARWVEGALETALRQPRDRARIAKDVLEMRELMAKERPAGGFWDLKLVDGGLVDIEFAAQFLQIVRAAEGGPIHVNTGEALQAFAVEGERLRVLAGAWRLQQDLSQVLKLALPDGADPAAEPQGLKALLARAGEARDFRSLTAKLRAARKAARTAFEAVVG